MHAGKQLALLQLLQGKLLAQVQLECGDSTQRTHLELKC